MPWKHGKGRLSRWRLTIGKRGCVIGARGREKRTVRLTRRPEMSRVHAGIAALVVALAWAPAEAQPKAGKVQPDRLPLGTVYTGAIVEGSFLVMEAGTNTNIPFTVTAPKFAKVRHSTTRHQQFGPGNDFIVGTVEFALDTS